MVYLKLRHNPISVAAEQRRNPLQHWLAGVGDFPTLSLL
jgi:hypothetical protein